MLASFINTAEIMLVLSSHPKKKLIKCTQISKITQLLTIVLLKGILYVSYKVNNEHNICKINVNDIKINQNDKRITKFQWMMINKNDDKIN